jgi:protein-disulfide isomerase
MGYIGLYFQTQANWLANASDSDKMLNDVAKVARTGGMSREQFDACLKDKTVEDQILQSRIEAVNKFNIDSTPSFVINGKTYSAVASYDEFKRLIDKACGF